MMKRANYLFSKISTEYTKCDIQSVYNISERFYVVYFLIDKYRSAENYSWLTVKKVFEFYGYKMTQHKPKVFYQIVDVLNFMVQEKLITVLTDLNKIGYTTAIEIVVNEDNFDCKNNFCMFYTEYFDFIQNRMERVGRKNVSKDSLIKVLLYVLSHIYNRANDFDNLTCKNDADIVCEAFFRNVQTVADDLNMSSETVYKCLDVLSTDTEIYKSPLKKYVLNYKKRSTTGAGFLPNIYVVNKHGWENETCAAIAKCCKYSKVPKQDINKLINSFKKQECDYFGNEK